MKLLVITFACLLSYSRAEFEVGCNDQCCQYISPKGKKVAECSYNKLTAVPQNVSPETQIFDLKGNNIRDIPKGYFDNFPNVEKLYINYNDLTALHKDTFAALTKLTYLDMHENEIAEIPAGLFRTNKAVKTLKMMELLIKDLPTGLFDSLWKLESLKLGGNSDKLKCGCDRVQNTKLQCSKFSQRTCTFKRAVDKIVVLSESFGCPEQCRCYKQNGLIVTTCSHKALTSVPNNIPAATQKLFLNHNDIAEVEVDAFAHLTNLKVLSLRGNKLTQLKAGLFNGLTNLKVLYVNYNVITSIADSSFQGLDNLEYLDLHGNIINQLGANAFSGLFTLKTLDLHNNAMVSLPLGVLEPLAVLKYMRVEGNLDLVCQCELVKKYQTLLRPGSYGKCTFNGEEEHIYKWSNKVNSPCV